MRKFLVLFLMVLLPLQWTAAVATDCCLRHDAAGQEHHAQLSHAEHGAGEMHRHPAANADTPQQQAGASDCDQACIGCFAHHCAGVLISLDALNLAPGRSPADTPYVSRQSDPRPDTLFRPPLAALA